MAERTRDLVDVLRAAEADLAAAPTAAAAARARDAVRAARARRRAMVVAGAAAAVAVVVAGAVVWSPRADAPPAGPGPAPSSGAHVPGMPQLRQADESDVRGAPEGSVLALWSQPPDASSTGAASPAAASRGSAESYLLLVRPDGEVLQLGRAPEGSVLLMSWDRAAGTASVMMEGTVATSVVDVVSGSVVGTESEPFRGADLVSPDGTARAWWSDSDAFVERDGVEVRHDLPALRCGVLDWADDARLLLSCPTLDAATLQPSGVPGATTVLMDAATGAVLEQRTVAPDEMRPQGPTVRLDDGRLVAWMVAPADDDGSIRTCPTRIDEVRGLDTVPFAEIPSDGVSFPGMARVPGGLVVSGTTACDGASGSAALWSVDATGEVTTLLPSVESVDGVPGLRSWVAGG
ncbi:hypothetical protein [Cellulomonas sp. S1-8]|uniref:hypothetical protein n=1 Tax=Cellulomonas sp. S1-8 TaxID=2904790 RepID=UPI0022439CF0|nr:hypothetical protein [Cellulomonas sp. S1-8]UZN03353.1 hypothetical protein OKX07_20265 [Cellulomonas sp. S1-8]